MFYTTFYTISTKYIFFFESYSFTVEPNQKLLEFFFVFFSFRYILIPRTVISNRIHIVGYSINIWIFRSYRFLDFRLKYFLTNLFLSQRNHNSHNRFILFVFSFFYFKQGKSTISNEESLCIGDLMCILR